MKQVLIIGITGLVGKHIAKELVKDKAITLAGFSRSRQAVAPEVRQFQGDLTDSRSLSRALEGIEQVIIAVSAKAGRCEAIEYKAVVEAARLAEQSGVRRIVYISGATTPYAPNWFEAGYAKKRTETVLSELSTEVVILRPSWIMESLSRFERNGAMSLIGDGRSKVHWLAASDLGKIVRYIINSRKDLSGAYALLGPQAISISDAAEMYAEANGLTRNVQKMPLWMGRFLSIFAGELRPVVDLARMYSRFNEEETAVSSEPLLPAADVTLSDWLKAKDKL